MCDPCCSCDLVLDRCRTGIRLGLARPLSEPPSRHALLDEFRGTIPKAA